MTYNVFSGTLNLAQSFNLSEILLLKSLQNSKHQRRVTSPQEVYVLVQLFADRL